MSLSTTFLTRAQTARIRNLFRDKRARQTDGAFIVEGAKPVRDLLLTHPTHVQMLVVASGYQQRESDRDRLLRHSVDVPTYGCLDRSFAALSGLETPQGILAIVQQPCWNEDELLERPVLFGLFGEQLQDPANVGAIIRTAAALNVSALWLTPESADIYNPKVVRATSGALLSLPIFVARDVTRFIQNHCAIYAAEVAGPDTVEMEAIHTIPRRVILAMGNESRGLSESTRQQATCRFTIPLTRQVESLNVAATAAIAMYYFGRLPKES
ncbi:MAG TPA: RNA methyltransferase [Nitrospira sp.]|nr:RNA methyltransferase [Nitrospira sp.]